MKNALTNAIAFIVAAILLRGLFVGLATFGGPNFVESATYVAVAFAAIGTAHLLRAFVMFDDEDEEKKSATK